VTRRLWFRVALVVGLVLVVEAVVFLGLVNSTRREVLTLGYEQKLTLLEDTGALARCDADPAAFALPDRGLGQVIPLRSDGRPFRADVAIGELGDAVAQANAGEVARVGSRFTAWSAVMKVDRAGPCALFYLTPPPVRAGVPLMKVVIARVLLALGIIGAILLLVVRPLTRRIRRLATQTRALSAADLVGEVDEGPDELGTIGKVINQASGRARSLIDAEKEQRDALHDLFADLAHDVRTPLASLKLSTDGLANGDDPEAAARTLRAEVEYLDAMFANLASLARIRSTRLLPLERRRGDLREVVEHVRDRFATLARDRGVALEIALPEAAALAEHDALTLEQALGNVVHNAIKYAEANVAVLLARHVDDLEIRVLDDGPGVDEAESARLTERRFRGARQEGVTGLGLGLAIASEILAEHAGSLDVARLDGGGTRVTLRLPASGERREPSPKADERGGCDSYPG